MNGAEKEDCFFLVFPERIKILRELAYAEDEHFDVPGDRHLDNGFPEKIPGYLIVNNNDACSLDRRHPGLEDLSVNKPVVYPDQYEIHITLSGLPDGKAPPYLPISRFRISLAKEMFFLP